MRLTAIVLLLAAGAAMSGRVAAVVADPADPRTVYVGAASGGVWKNSNAGLTWTPVFDREEVHAIGAIALGERPACTPPCPLLRSWGAE